MPQMSPMFWVLLLLLYSSMVFTIISKIYYMILFDEMDLIYINNLNYDLYDDFEEYMDEFNCSYMIVSNFFDDSLKYSYIKDYKFDEDWKFLNLW